MVNIKYLAFVFRWCMQLFGIRASFSQSFSGDLILKHLHWALNALIMASSTITISLRSSNKLARNRKRRMAKPVERLFDPAEVRSIMMKRHVNICISDQPILSEKSLLIENCSVSKFHEKLDYFSWNLFDHILKLHANFSKWTDSKQQALE